MNQKGFTLIEFLIYTAIFTISAFFLINILSSGFRIQGRQMVTNELNQQISFVASTIERLVKNSSLVVNDAGVASSSLILRMASSTIDPTIIFASGTTIYLQEGNSQPSPLTNDAVNVSNFQVIKYENPGGRAVVQVDLTLTYNSDDPKLQLSRDLKTAITRVSAATFDFNLVPSVNNAYDIGLSNYAWQNAFFSGTVGIGTTDPGNGIKLGINGGNIALKGAGDGLILKASDGVTCAKIFIINGTGVVSSTLVACP